MIKKYNILLEILTVSIPVIFIFSSFYHPKDDPKTKVKIIVIDPGHGGKDPGCNGVTCKEKDVALAVALKFGKLVEERMKDVKVIFTRKTDIFVELEDRAKIANENNADLFVSIHCNAAGKPVMIKDKKTGKMRPKTFKNSRGKLVVVETTNPEPYGSETYVMGLKNEEGKMKVAQRENSAMLLEDNYETKYQGFDPNSEESYIIMSNYTSSYVIQSAALALKIQEQYSKKAGRVDKGVHRQSIWVLWRTSMPSILTEIGYLTNPHEEKFLGSENGQNYLAACLFRAFRSYKDEQEGVKKLYSDDIENQIPLEREKYTIVEEQQEKTDEKIEKEAEVIVKKENHDFEIKEQKDKEVLSEKIKADSLSESKKQQVKTDELDKKYNQLITMADLNFKNKNYDEATDLYQKANGVKDNKDAYASKKIKEIETLQRASTIISVENKEEKTKTDIVFKVQFAVTDKEVDVKIKFPNVNDVWFYKAGALVKYTSGNFNSINDANKQLSKLKGLGYKDCFVVAFKDGIRMDVNEAKKLKQ